VKQKTSRCSPSAPPGPAIAKAGIEVTVRVPSDTRRGGRQQETRAFRTTRKDLLALADWLRCRDVTKIGMESTGDYWKPVYFLLESEGLDCVLYHAAQVKALPGRPKTGKLDSAWLAKITERRAAGQLRAAGGHPPAAHPHPLPQAPDPGPHRREAAGREAAGGRAPEALQPSPPASVTPRRWPSSPAAPCAARSASWKRPSTAPS
jgi:hypothetical protein